MRLRLAAAVVALVLVAVPALADTVTKTDGTVIDGEVTYEDESQVTIKCKLGVLTIPKAEVLRVERAPSYDPEPDLEQLRTETLARLEEIRTRCEAAKVDKKLRAVEDMARSVKAWTLTPKPPAEKKEATPTGGPTKPEKEAPKGDRETFTKTYERWQSILNDKSMTDVARQKALATFRTETEGRKLMLSIKVIDVRLEQVWNGVAQVARMLVRGNLWEGRETQFYFFEPKDHTRLEKAARGSSITFDVALTCNQFTSEPMFIDPRLR